jgi:hypothetical protein
MKMKSTFKKKILPIILLVFLWGIALLVHFTSERPTSTSDSYLPKNYNFLAKIDAKSIFKETALELLFEAKDEKVLSGMYEKLSESSDIKGNLGIDLLSDAFVFSVPFKKMTIKGVCVNLKNKSDFQEYSSDLISENVFTHVSGKKGYLFSASEKISEGDKKHFIDTELGANANKKELKTNALQKNSIYVITKENVFGANTTFSSTQIGIKTLKNTIKVEGDLTQSKKALQTINNIDFKLKSDPKLFNFASGIIPSTLQDTLKYFTNKIGLTLPDIKSVSFNYEGLEMMESVILPNMNLIIQFQEDVSTDEFLNNELFLSTLEATSQENSVIIEGKTYYIHQINSSCISIGIDRKVNHTKSNHVFESNGNLSNLFEIKNGGMFVSFLEGIPVFKAPKELFNASENFTLVIKRNDNRYKLDGELKFKEGVYKMNELTKFALEIQKIF